MSGKKHLLKSFLNQQSQNTKHKGVLQNIWQAASEKFSKTEIIRNHGVAGRNEPKWRDLLIGWRRTAGL